MRSVMGQFAVSWSLVLLILILHRLGACLEEGTVCYSYGRLASMLNFWEPLHPASHDNTQ
jgi:hypothetical protein